MEIVYWSGTGNTEAMAKEIEKGILAKGKNVKLTRFETADLDEVISQDVLLLGCPAMGEENLEETVVEPFFKDLEKKISQKKIGLFGSYGWGDGEWMDNWKKRVVEAGGILLEPAVIVKGEPVNGECDPLIQAAIDA